MTTATFRLTNRSERPLVFQQGANTSIIVPPASKGVPGSTHFVIHGVDSVEDRSTLDRSFEAFKGAIDAGELVVEGTTCVRLRNASARVLTLFQGFTVPPASETLGVELILTTAEHDSLERVLAAPTVQRWIAAGDLVVEVIDAPQPPSQSPISA